MIDNRLPPLIDPPRYAIEIDGLPLININRTKGAHFRVKGPKVAALKEAARLAAEGIPTMTRARVVCWVTREVLGTKAKWDPANWYPSAKACVDGFTLAGMFPDDSVHHVLGPDLRGVTTEKCRPYGKLTFHIYDLSERGSHGEQDHRSPDL